jgi:hypothetical protein
MQADLSPLVFSGKRQPVPKSGTGSLGEINHLSPSVPDLSPLNGTNGETTCPTCPPLLYRGTKGQIAGQGQIEGEKAFEDNRTLAPYVLGVFHAYRHIPLIVAHMGKTCFPCRVFDDFLQTAKVNELIIKDLQNERK